MREWLRGKSAGLVLLLLIAVLVVGGLGWATAAALRLEAEQRAERAEAERNGKLRLALWRLDGFVAPFLVREDSRPFNHYSALSAAPVAFNPGGHCWEPGAVMEPSPLLSADLPPWMQLHFQVAVDSGWESPQVLAEGGEKPVAVDLRHMLQAHGVALANVTPERAERLHELAEALPPSRLLGPARDQSAPPTQRDTILLALARRQNRDNQKQELASPEAQQGQARGPNAQPAPQQAPVQISQAQQDNDYDRRQQNFANSAFNDERNPLRQQRDIALNNTTGNGLNWFSPDGNQRKTAHGVEAEVRLSPMIALWADGGDGRARLMLLRLVRIEQREVCQGILLDAEALRAVLAEQVRDLLPGARVVPVREAEPPQPERTMSALPFRLDPGPAEPAAAEPGWTPLRVGLALSWTAALVALLAVGLGGWSLLDLSERRIRFVSAVTHELRTPLTTLRLYLDMLMNGLVRDEQQRAEYIRTLHAEADRLTRLVGNVLDFSRLENQRPRLSWAVSPVAELLAQARDAWQSRCHDAGKELIVENAVPLEAALRTDAGLLQQVLGNLIDNACKYSRDAADRRVWLRARLEDGRAIFEVEDRGPGVPVGERRTIFRSFRRGRTADVTAGGVGLGLALARRWAKLLGGKLMLMPAPAAGGACFRLTLPCGSGTDQAGERRASTP